MFRAPFVSPFSKPFPQDAAAVPWWLSGGVAAANAIGVYQPKGAASLAASYINLANPGTYNAAPGVAPTWDVVSGWVWNGTSQCLTTGITPVNNQTWSAIVKFSNGLTSGGIRPVFGAYVSPRGFTIRNHHAGLGVVYFNGAAVTKTPSLDAGVLAVAGKRAYRNGADEGLADIGASAGALPTIYIGGVNDNGSITSYFSGKVQAVAFYNTTLTAPQVLAISTAMAAL